MFHKIQRKLPNKDSVHGHPVLRRLSSYLLREDLWRFNRNTVARAFFVGIFAAFIPVPFETVIAAVLAHMVGANLPLSLVLVWISNPFTWIPLYTPGYLVGCALLQIQPFSLKGIESLSDLPQTFDIQHIITLFIGNSVLGITFATLSYFCIQGLWRISVRNRWKERGSRRKQSNRQG